MTVTTWAPAPADLEAYRATEQAPRDTLRHAPVREAIAFAKDDPDLIVGLAVVKPGVFNGTFEVTPDDLTLWVARFEELRGTFRPPMRLDHSWDVLSVIGRFEALRVENRADESAGGTVVPMLVGDVRLVGTKAEKAAVREWIEGDKLNERSSEFWPYRTNTGAEYPSVFAGCAFVDIPAVEGLGAITLRRATLAHGDNTPEGTDVDDEQTPETEVDETGTPVGVIGDADDDGPDNLPGADADVVAEGDEPDDAPLDEDEDEDEGDDEQPPAADDVAPASTAALAAQLRAAPDDATALANLDRLIAERVEAQVQSATRLAAHTARGVITPAVRPHAEALLRHDEKSVRDAADALLASVSAPVNLDTKAGDLRSIVPSEGGTVTPDELRELSAHEFGQKWAELTTEQRKSAEFRAAYDAVMGTKTTR